MPWNGAMVVLAFLLAGGLAHAQNLKARLHSETEGEVAGPSIVVALPADDNPATIDPAEQVSLLPISGGNLRVVTYDEVTTGTETIMQALSRNDLLRGDMVIVVTHGLAPSGEDRANRPPVLRTSDAEGGEAILRRVLAPSFKEGVPDFVVTGLSGGRIPAGSYVLEFCESETAPSRQGRWLRGIVAEVLKEKGIAESSITTRGMAARGMAYAMYDCEGVGGSGPRQLEKVAKASEGAFTVTRVCPEDIREGALDQFRGVLFPGGSGKAIAQALEPEGQGRVKDFVKKGGGYVGICAGAYLATCRIDGYLEMAGMYHNQPWRKGSGVLKVELTPEGEKVFGTEFKSFKTRYNNGPVWGHEEGDTPEGEFAPVTVLANFREAAKTKEGRQADEMVGTPAITATEYGAGRLLMISPHPETHAKLFPLVTRGVIWAVKQGN